MPFDGFSPTTTTTDQEIAILSRMLAFFQDDDRWLQGAWRDDAGRACLVGALNRARRELRVKGDKTRLYLVRAIRQHHAGKELIAFNDSVCAHGQELRDTIRFALLLATYYPADRLPRPPSRPRRYVPFQPWEAMRGSLVDLGSRQAEFDFITTRIPAGHC